MSDLKEISDSLRQEFVRATKPLGNWNHFLNVILDNYRDKTNCVYGWVLYDWLCEHKYILDSKPTHSNVAKAEAMDELLAKKILTTDQIQTYINEKESRKIA